MNKKIYGVILIAITVIAVGGYFFPKSVASILGAVGTRYPNGLSTDSTSPSAGQVRTTSLTVTGASTQTGTTTVTQSVDGLVIGGTISTSATGTVRTLDTNTTGPKICKKDTSYLFVQNNGSFAPSLVFSLGTSTSAAAASRNLIASSTVASTTTTLLNLVNGSFLYQQGETLTAIFGDITNTEASSTYFSRWTAEAGIWCQDISI